MANASVDLLRTVHNGNWKSAPQSDIIGAIAWGIDAVIGHCRHLKYQKLVRIITNSQTMIDEGLIEGILEQAIGQGIAVDIVGSGFCDPTDEEIDDSSIPPAQPLLFSISAKTGGRFFHDAIFASTVEPSIALHQPSSRPYAPTFLTLGDRDREDSVIRFPVQFVVKVKSAELPKATKLSIPALEMVDGEDDDWGDLVGGVSATKPTSSTAPLPAIDTVKVQMGTGFRVADDSGNADPKDATVYDADATISAYHYGKALVPLGDWEKDPVSNDGSVGLMVIAFVPAASIRRDMFMSSTRYVVPNIKFETADIRLAALVSIMRTRGLAAIARYVYNARSSANSSDSLRTPQSPATDVGCS
ncbi:hypothetical protein BCR44DRAFT_1278505 [Catenaria anguillulae PL171]|uniref:Ku domain-containing protein n=1 Tax=Catenaria anguillulae PL171 TaxID=765915 RepID=A0A1Y2HDL9_9FUNG|nr:hypothetical protein BCR44DRAFT_1278505 [Catenaria anguillulae PL171]